MINSNHFPGKIQKRHFGLASRHIPQRNGFNADIALEKLTNPNGQLSKKNSNVSAWLIDGISKSLLDRPNESLQRDPIYNFRVTPRNPMYTEREITDQAAQLSKKEKNSNKCPPIELYKTLDLPLLSDDINYSIISCSKINKLVVGNQRGLYCVDFEGDKANRIYGEVPNEVMSLDWLNERDIAFYETDGLVKIFDSSKKRISITYPSLTNIYRIKRATDNTFFTGDSEGNVMEFDKREKNQICFKEVSDNKAPIQSFAISPDDNYLAIGSNNLSILDLRYLGNNQQILTAHKISVLALMWQSDNVLLSGGGDLDCSIKGWDTSRGFSTFQLQCDSQVTGLHMSANRDLISTHGHGKSFIKSWKIEKNQPSEVINSRNLPQRALFSIMNKERDSLMVTTMNEKGILAFFKGFHDRNPKKEPEPGELSIKNAKNTIR